MLEILAELGVPGKGVVGTIEEETANLVKEIVEKEKAARRGSRKRPQRQPRRPLRPHLKRKRRNLRPHPSNLSSL